jgi:hypothetical protein
MSTTVIKDDRGHTWEVASRNDAVVHAKLSNSVNLTVDNRGKPSTLDELIKLYFMQWQAEQAKEKD